MEDIEEVVVAKINGLNLEQLRLVAKCLELDSEIISTGMRSKLLKLILRTVCYEDSELPLIRELNEFIDTIYKQPIPMRIFEKIVHDQVSTFIKENTFLNDRQSGFRKLFSTTTAVLDVSENILEQLADKNNFVGAVLIDLKEN